MVSPPRADARNEPLAVPVRRWWTRLSSAHILIFSAGVLAFIANLAVLRADASPPLVAVATTDLLPGTAFDSARHAEFVPMQTSDDVLARLVTGQHAESVDGMVVSTRIPEGSPVGIGSLVDVQESAGRRLMSIPIERARAAGGQIETGDTVDVIAVDDGMAKFVAVGLEVVALPTNRSSSFAGTNAYHIVVAVEAGTSLDLASALHGSSLHVVRSTGAPAPGVTDD